MIFFIKTLYERALVAGYEPQMIIVDGISAPKPNLDWIDVKEAWRILEVAYEETTKVKISRLQLIVRKDPTLKIRIIIEEKMVRTLQEGIMKLQTDGTEKMGRKRREKEGLSDVENVGELALISEEDNGMNAFTVCVTEIDSDDESESYEENCDNELTFEELKVLWKEDTEARAIQKERIQDLMEENERLMSVISSVKLKLKAIQNEHDQTIKSVKMLNLRAENLDVILNSGQISSSKYGLGFDSLA
ncbi:gag-pol polyprotein [Cucumis melo var. makuwa]|uniref:Gag-pol polyprotein n=1 Tax=Cucumis melo var. makuwa TaxID=1194695 RepID=A0A5D3DRM4_CUCMM|nr:gag-pol polyprotein [Cucumis melo var. makuwa]TYK26039.1 gag-pol polyprotein [Cucumis melo var. makuwa]